MNTAATAKKDSVFSGSGDAMGSSLDALFNTEAEFAFIDLTMIEIKKQVRELFEDADNTLAELAASIKKEGVLQPILLREIDTGYELVAGERRYRASKLAGLTKIPSFIRKMTDEQAEQAQFIENIHRLNLTQIEEAKKVQADLDAMNGDVKAVLAKYNKSASWLSKILSLLNLTPEAKRLITENISADTEVISAVRQIEKADPAKAKALVDDLKANTGKNKQGSARAKTEAVKQQVKPTKKGAEKAANAAGKPSPTPAAKPSSKAKKDDADPLRDLYKRIHLDISIRGLLANHVVSKLTEAEREGIKGDLAYFHQQGKVKQDAGRSIIGGFNQGMFAHGDYREFKLAAYTYGLNGVEFNLLTTLQSVK